MEIPDEAPLERIWLGIVGGIIVILGVGSLLFRQRVYGNFLWHYFWGPVYADAHSAVCAVWNGGKRTLLYSAQKCQAAPEPVAYPGYTIVSEIGYMITLLIALTGVILLLRKLDIGNSRSLFYALLPFMFFGGALRVVEDANDAVPQGVDPLITYPWNTLIISPTIYFTVFFITLFCLLTSLWLVSRDIFDDYEIPLFGMGSFLASITVLYLVYLSLTKGYVAFHPLILLIILTLATVSSYITWEIATNYLSELRQGVGEMGFIVVWGHAIDGAANVIGLDWGKELGLKFDLVPKHPVNKAIVQFSRTILPETITHFIGAAWPFLLVKLMIAVFAVWLFNEDLIDSTPRYSILLLIAILAVGLGPGTRDMLRATFGV